MEKKVESYDVIVIGGGAAGLTSAIYAGRARLSTILLEQTLCGGLATYTNEIENYPGFPEGMTGGDLMRLFERQAKKFGVKVKLAQVSAADLLGDTKRVETNRVIYEAPVVIVATGGKPRLTGAKGEQDFLFDKGISFCATCDAAYYTDKEVMVIGSGDAAIEEAMFLTKFASKVYISVIHDVGIVDANKVAQEQAFKNQKLHFIWNTMVDEFKGGERLETVVLRNVRTGEKLPVKVDGCFLFIGYLPQTALFKDVLNLNDRGYVVTNEDMETNIAGVFAAGDVRVKTLRQVATAVGDGAIAGFMAERYLADREFFMKEILQKERPGLVYCWDPTDAECREFMSVVESVVESLGDRVKFTRVDFYKNARMAERLGLRRAPSVALLHEGEVRRTLEGTMTADGLLNAFDEVARAAN
ncbi:MAG: FAD-dependent oxidoreductase [Bacillota bacterium]